MRDNGPITEREIEIPDGEPLVSRTDTGGRIVFVNQIFVDVSGFQEQELIGAPHNILRHPHMPKAAFANLWTTIKAGRPWEGLVKNRAKSGDFYWVRANVTPVVEDGKVAGFISIRAKPGREEVKAAESAYAELRAGRGKNLGLRDGELIAVGFWPWLIEFARSITGRLLVTTLIATLAIAGVGWLGFAGMAGSNATLHAVYDHDLVAVNQLRNILDLIRDDRNLVAQLAISIGRGAKADTVLAEREPPLLANLGKIDRLWQAWRGGDLSAEQQEAAKRFEASYAVLAHDVIHGALDMARSGQHEQLDILFQKQAPPLFQAVFDANRALVSQQIRRGQQAYLAAVAGLEWRLIAGVGGGMVGLATLVAMSWLLLRTIHRALREVERHFDAIARNDPNWVIRSASAREFYPATTLLRALRARLSFAQFEQGELQRKAAGARREAINDMAVKIEREAGGAVEQIATRTDSMAREAEAMAGSAERVSTNAGLVADAAGQALTNAQVVAAASEQLAASIREVSSQVEHASSVARQAEQKGTEAASTVGSLSEAADRIGAVVRLIADIAGRTNLLALNATIEAARAGEAGKGFAVVAGEVKALATQTAKATQEISQQISALQGATGAAVSAIGDVGGTLSEVARISVAVAAAVDEQTAATQEIARNVAQSSGAVQEVTQRIAEVSSEATLVGRQSGKLRGEAGEIASDITALRGALVHTVRTATVDADRRIEPRYSASEDCSLVDAQSGARITGTLCDVSSRGAAVSIGTTRADLSGRVTLVLDRRDGVRAGAAVHAVSPDGRAHLEFDQQGMDASFRAAIQAIIGAQQPAAAA